MPGRWDTSGSSATACRAFAVIALTGGEAKTAATLLGFLGGFAERFGGLSPCEKDELDEAIAQVREALGNEAFDAAWTEGSALSLDRAVGLSHTVTASGEPAATTGGRRPSG